MCDICLPGCGGCCLLCKLPARADTLQLSCPWFLGDSVTCVSREKARAGRDVIPAEIFGHGNPPTCEVWDSSGLPGLSYSASTIPVSRPYTLWPHHHGPASGLMENCFLERYTIALSDFFGWIRYKELPILEM